MAALPETLTASGRSSDNLSLPVLHSKMELNPIGYEFEVDLLYSQFESALDLFGQQAALGFSSVIGVGADPTFNKDLGDRAMFLAHVTPFYRQKLASFPSQLAGFLLDSAQSMHSALRYPVTQALILLVNKDIIGICETLPVFIEIQTLGDSNLKKLAFSHVVQTVRRMNQNHKSENDNQALQNILFSMLQQEDAAKARRALNTLCELHQKKVWVDGRTANAICMACLHSSRSVTISALSFLLDFEKIEDEDDSDSSKDHAIHYSPLIHLKDKKGFAEILFSRLQSDYPFRVKLIMCRIVARTIGLHRLILLKFYPFLQIYVQPHQPNVTDLLAAAVQACHDMVPPDAVEPLFKQIVRQVVHDRSRPESIAVGLDAIREICLRMPLLMNEDMLQNLVLYKRSDEKTISATAGSLISLFRELCPSLLINKDLAASMNEESENEDGEHSLAAHSDAR